jgi:hypothetical protein
MARKTDLDRLTRRWRDRHDAKLAGERPRASGGREALARRGFPYRDQSPAEYADEHAADMIGFTYDEESYADADLDAWLVELGGILRERRAKADGSNAEGSTANGATAKSSTAEGSTADG